MLCTQVTSSVCLVADGFGAAAFLGKCCSPGQVQLVLASLVLCPGGVCSLVGWGLCRELCSDKAPVFGSSFAPVFPLFWLCPVLGSLSPEWEALLQEFLVLESLALAQPFPEDLLKPRLLERSARSSLTLAAALHQQCLGHSGSGDPVDMAGATGQLALCVQCHHQ